MGEDAKQKKKKKKKPGLLTRLLTEPVSSTAEDGDKGDSDEQSLDPFDPGTSENDPAPDEDDGSAEDAEPKKKKLGFLKRLLTEPVAASSDEKNAPEPEKQTNGAPGGGAPAEQSGAKGSDTKTDALTTEAFEGQLQALLDQHGKVLAGKVQFVDLSDAKNKFPDRPEDIIATMHDVAASVTQSYLAKEDIYTRLKDAHLIVFGRLDPAAAQQRCVQITKEIADTLEAQGVNTAGLAPKSVVGEIEGRAQLAELSIEEATPDSATDDAEPTSIKGADVRS